MADAQQRWAEQLAGWAIPEEIRAQAPEDPWGFAPELFTAPEPGEHPRSRATEVAAAALPDDGAVLDVGCGGGAAAFALAPPAGRLIGVDQQADMTELFAATAAERGLEAATVTGAWPDVGDRVPAADVVVSHHVLYNIPDPVPFARALEDHARARVVIEITERHPLVTRAPLWRHFWDLDRPDGPSAWLAAEVLSDAGVPVRAEVTARTHRHDRSPEVMATFWRRNLCLPPEREPEVAELLQDLASPNASVVLWWDAGQWEAAERGS